MMHLKRIEEDNTLKVTLTPEDLVELTMAEKRYVMAPGIGAVQGKIVETVAVTHHRQRRLARPEVYLEDGRLGILLPDLFLPVFIRGIKTPDEQYLDDSHITIIEASRVRLQD